MKTRKISESDVEDYLHDRVKALGGDYRRVNWMGRKNAPDDRVMLPGQCFWAECKAPDASMNTARVRAQLREHKRMRDLGETVHLFDSFASIDKVLPL
jgi:hypothetical protein